jgi:hypothetical protein
MADLSEERLALLVERLLEECRRRGQLPVAEVERRALQMGVRPTAALDQLAVTEGFEVDLKAGLVRCR